MKPDLIIFDLDGTLIDSIGGIAYSANYVLNKYGYPTHESMEYKKLIGHGVRGTITNGLPANFDDEDMIEIMVGDFVEYYRENYLVETTLFAGVSELLDQLEKLEVPIAINTNKHATISHPIIEALFSKWDLVGYYGPDDLILKKPDPMAADLLLKKASASPENSLYIGDSEVDVATALNAGMKSVWVSWGFRDASALKEQKPDMTVNHPLEILDLIKQ